MLNFLIAALGWVAVVFDWVILPVGLVLLALALREKTRGAAAVGFLAAASISAALLSLSLAASVFHLLGYGRALAELLLNYGPALARDYLTTLMRQNAPGLLALAPMLAAAVLAASAAAWLRREREERCDGGGPAVAHVFELGEPSRNREETTINS